MINFVIDIMINFLPHRIQLASLDSSFNSFLIVFRRHQSWGLKSGNWAKEEGERRLRSNGFVGIYREIYLLSTTASTLLWPKYKTE